MKRYYLDLFHGIGGFALGAYWAGMRFDAHYCSDIEPWCQKLYALRFPDSIQLGDITKIKWEDLPNGEWIISGGFPCQDISIAGKGEGITGARSGLWFTYQEAIRVLRPRFAIMENVGMLVHRGLREVLGSLAEIGYDAEWQDIRAADVGAPHRRERIWIVAYRMQPGSEIGGTDKADEKKSTARRIDDRGSGIDDRGIVDTGENETIPHPSFQLSHGSGKPRRRRGEFTDGGDVADAVQYDVEGDGSTWIEKSVMGQRFEEIEGGFKTIRGRGDWSTEPDVGRLAHGIPHRVDRLRGLGNAIVPEIAEVLFLRIRQLL